MNRSTRLRCLKGRLSQVARVFAALVRRDDCLGVMSRGHQVDQREWRLSNASHRPRTEHNDRGVGRSLGRRVRRPPGSQVLAEACVAIQKVLMSIAGGKRSAHIDEQQSHKPSEDNGLRARERPRSPPAAPLRSGKAKRRKIAPAALTRSTNGAGQIAK